jgi:5-methylcytosine-specific restriction protein A
LTPPGNIFLFTRTDNKVPFTFHGNVISQAFSRGTPSKIIWRIVDSSASLFPDEQIELWEGALKVVKVNKYERNPDARLLCIGHYGTNCQVCGFNFDKYGDIGVGYIHIHHLTLVSSIGENYIVDPIKDLRPVCANCHAIIHKRNPPYTIEELRDLLNRNS